MSSTDKCSRAGILHQQERVKQQTSVLYDLCPLSDLPGSRERRNPLILTFGQTQFTVTDVNGSIFSLVIQQRKENLKKKQTGTLVYLGQTNGC